MKIKRYTAKNMQQALEKIKSDLGQDAVILHTKKVKRGGIFGFFAKTLIEVTAASEFKDNFNNLTTTKNNRSNNKPDPSMDQLKDIKENLDDIKKFIHQMSNKEDTEVEVSRRSTPALSRVKNYLIQRDVDSKIVDAVLAETSDRLTGKQLKDYDSIIEELKVVLEEEISNILKDNEVKAEGPEIMAFIGPTGVGKTTTIAKLAANYTLYENKEIALLTTDVYRIAAVDQLKTYAEIIQMPIEVIYNLNDMRQNLDKFKDKDCIMIDTAGISPKNKIQINELKAMLETANPSNVYLVLSATTKEKDIYKIINNYQIFNPDKIIFTKLDETSTHGFILNVIKAFKYPVSYLTFGQDVPDDIEKVEPEKLAKMILGENVYGRSG